MASSSSWQFNERQACWKDRVFLAYDVFPVCDGPGHPPDSEAPGELGVSSIYNGVGLDLTEFDFRLTVFGVQGLVVQV